MRSRIEKAQELARKVFEVEAQAILNLKEKLGPAFVTAVELILNTQGKLIVTGIGKSGQIARKIASTFSSTGTPAIFLHPAESAHGDLGMIAPTDLIVALSYGGETQEMQAILGFAARRNQALIAMTGNLQSELSASAQVTLDVRINREACPLGLAPTASSTAMLAMGDALAMVVMELKGFTAEDFAVNHPGGGLGFKLTRLKDLMHTGKAMPLLKLDTSMKQVLSVMSHGEVRGTAGIIDDAGDLIGVITDGDLRRKLESSANPFLEPAASLMTKNPRTIDASEVAEKALFMMEQFRINLLFVLDKNSTTPKRPIGIIHIQDLLRAKIR